MSGPVVITGAAGNVGQKLTAHLRAKGRELRLIDIDPRGDPDIEAADLSVDGRWTDSLDGAQAIVHLAANPSPDASWDELAGPNIDAVVNLYAAAHRRGVRKVVLASSVWAVAERRFDEAPITVTAPCPGSVPYAISKAFAERVAQSYAGHGIGTIAVRLGWCRPGDNPPVLTGDPWGDGCWISNEDACAGFEAALAAEIQGFRAVNLTSEIEDGRWSLDEARALIGYRPASTLRRPRLLNRALDRLRAAL